MDTPLSVLQQYWKHQRFRPFQESIIQSVLNRQDTFALLPTGGGKSVCFQVPGIILDGICLVVSPLIALMNDQVAQLRKRGIQAVAIHSAMSYREIDLHLNNCVYGKIKFLYLSPERLQTELFIARVKQMQVSLIAVDEAHCISQWGYDFRPAYLLIASLREAVPGAPLIALTATATRDVQEDVVDKLQFRIPYEMFRSTFARENLAVVVRKSENKEKKLLEILRKVPGSSIVYLRSRKATQALAVFLQRQGVSAGHYHAGMSMQARTAMQDKWLNNELRVIVATNAFGMGIDKDDVRLVIHLDLPENPESYYQEAGRGGRDGKKAYAAVIYQDADVLALRRKVEEANPSVDYLKRVYQALANYYQLAAGSGEGESFDFDLATFANQFHLQAHEAYHALKKLEEEGLIQLTESFYSPSLVHITADAVRLYEFQVANAGFDPLIKMMLRLYGGELHHDYLRISESHLAKALQLPLKQVVETLRHLDRLQLISYRPSKDQPQLSFLLPRQDAEWLPLDLARLATRKKLNFSKMEAMIRLVTQEDRCRMLEIQYYFGEESEKSCGLCDVCVARRKRENLQAAGLLKREIEMLLGQQPFTVEELESRIAPPDPDLMVEIIREMLDDGELYYDPVWRLVKK